jgi:tetratricopeptide (TPR) repeat protein
VSLGSALFNIGELDGARRSLEEAHAMWRPEFPALALDPSVACRALLGFIALLQGDPVAGAGWMGNALEHAAEINSPYNLSYARELAAQYHAHAGDRSQALEYASQAEALATEHGFVVHAAVVDVVRGWALRDVTLLRNGIGQYEGCGQLVATSFFRALLVEVLLELERVPEALAELVGIRGFVERSGEQRQVPELHRLEAECLRRTSPDGRGRTEAVECLRRAVSVARARGARLWEQRATAALAAI